MDDLITIIINVYNGEKYINKCLDCIINQTYKNLEILIINDGSTDKTLDICKKYKDKRIRIITTKNLGLSLSRNVGIDNSKGEYLYFIDVDDFIELDTISYLYNLIKKNDFDIATCKHLVVSNYDVDIKQQKEIIEKIDSREMLKKIFLRYDNSVAIWNKLIKKGLFDNLRFENRIINDVAFTHKLVLNTNKIIYSNQIKYYHFENIDSTSFKKNNDYDRSIDLYNAVIERYNYVHEIFPDFIENNYAILELFTRLYLRTNDKVIKYLDDNGIISLYNKIFTLKVLSCRISIRQKIKLILFRFVPRLYRKIYDFYLFFKR